MTTLSQLIDYAQLSVDDATETELEFTTNRIGIKKFKTGPESHLDARQQLELQAESARPELRAVIDMVEVMRSQSSSAAGGDARVESRRQRSTIRMTIRKLPGTQFYFNIITLMRRFVYQPSDNQKQFIRKALHAMLPVMYDGRTAQGPAPSGGFEFL